MRYFGESHFFGLVTNFLRFSSPSAPRKRPVSIPSLYDTPSDIRRQLVFSSDFLMAFYKSILLSEFDKRPIEADIRDYAKYLLSEGSKEEKRELLSCLKSKIEIQSQLVYLRVGVDRN